MQNLINQLLSSLVSMQNEDFGTVCDKKLFMKNWFNNWLNIGNILFVIFLIL